MPDERLTGAASPAPAIFSAKMKTKIHRRPSQLDALERTHLCCFFSSNHRSTSCNIPHLNLPICYRPRDIYKINFVDLNEDLLDLDGDLDEHLAGNSGSGRKSDKNVDFPVTEPTDDVEIITVVLALFICKISGYKSGICLWCPVVAMDSGGGAFIREERMGQFGFAIYFIYYDPSLNGLHAPKLIGGATN